MQTPKILSLVFFACIASCASHPFDYKGGGPTVVSTTGTTVSSSNATDILFVIDNSGSMQDKHDNLVRNANEFVSELTKNSTNYHLGIVTTDIIAPTDQGRLRTASGGPLFWTSPSADDPNAAAIEQAIVQGFSATVESIGIEGSFKEAGLGAVLAALAPTDPNVAANNAGFLRPTADLAIVIVTDEDDCSPTAAGYATMVGWQGEVTCYEQAQLLAPVDQLVTSFAALKNGNINQVRVALIGGGLPGQDANTLMPRGCMVDAQGQPSDACGCWEYDTRDAYFCASIHQDFNQPCVTSGTCLNNCPSTDDASVCDTPLCPATPASRYTSFLASMEKTRSTAGLSTGTIANSICQAEYGTSLVAIADRVIQSPCFTLTTPPLSPDDLGMQVQRLNSDGNTYGAVQIVPHMDPKDTQADCNACAGKCASGAWQYTAGQMCLVCGMQKEFGDKYAISELTQAPNSKAAPAN